MAIAVTLDPLTTYSMNNSLFDSENDSLMYSGDSGVEGGVMPYNPWLDTSCYEMVAAGKYFPVDFSLVSPELLINIGVFYRLHNYILKFYVSPLVALFGILMNGLFLFVLARVREMKTATNVYLANLAVADIMFLVLSAVDLLRTWNSNPGILLHFPYYTTAQCVSFSLLMKLTFYGSVCMVTLVTFERYMAICHPLKHRMIIGKKYTLKVTVVAWIAATTMGSLGSMIHVRSDSTCFLWPPGLKEMARYHIGDVQTICFSLTLSWYNVSYGIQSSFFIVNLILNIVLYTLIVARLGKRNIGGEGSQERQNDVQRVRNQVAKMLIINGTIFFILMLPYEIHTAAEFVGSVTWYKVLIDPVMVRNFEFYGTCLRFVNSSLNPLIYGLSNPRYRQAYRKAFGCCLKAEQGHPVVKFKEKVVTGSTNADVQTNKL
ncbi:growth hormone secretagogue receptor type 1-like [Amphiura filiformis]|uniref:growth hormone secretagogue receptor type 1-like n=1 Tax=Amphiura filiformis TaxID=82378 RepID=UPI003B21D3FD